MYSLLTPPRSDTLDKPIANLLQRFWSFESLTGSTVFRLVLLCWIYSWLAFYVPLVLFAPFLGVENASVYIRTLVEWLWGCAIVGGWNIIPFSIYLAIWSGRIKKDKTLYTRRLCAIVYGALGLIIPMAAVYSLYYWVGWEWFSSNAEFPIGFWQEVGLMLMLVAIFVQPVGLIVGSALGYALGRTLERRGIRLSNIWAIVGTLGFSVLLVIGLAMFTYLTGGYGSPDYDFGLATHTKGNAGFEWHVRNKEALGLLRQGEYDRLVIAAQKKLEVAEANVGPNHPDVVRHLDYLAYLYYTQGDYAKAEPLLIRLLAIEEKALGSNHPHVADSLNNLAVFYETQGDYAKAELLYKRSLAIRINALGRNHPAVATSLQNLAALYRTTERDPVPPSYLYKGSNVNIRVPNSEGWHLVWSSTTGMMFMRSGVEQNETFVADLTMFLLPEIRTNNEFLSFIKKGFKADTDHSRFEIVEADFVLTEKRSYPCVRADSILRDKHAQTSSSQRETQLLQLGALHCMHPVRKNTFFSIGYSHRGRSLYSNFNTEAQGFIDGVQVPGH